MRRLIALLVIFMGVNSLLVVSLRQPRPASNSCVQLLDPVTGSVLTVDINTEHAMLDARTTYPVPTIATEFDPFDDQEVIYDPISPDKNYLLTINSRPQSPVFDIDIGPRSATRHRRLNARGGAISFAWSPLSTHIAFTDIDYHDNMSFVYFGIADANGSNLKREEFSAYSSYANYAYRPSWSPDGTIATQQFMMADVATVLALRPVEAEHSHYLTFPNETINLFKWSPTSMHAFVLTENQNTNEHRIYVISRDGTLLGKSPITLDFAPYFGWAGLIIGIETYAKYWSADGQYFYLPERAQQYVAHIFNQNGDQITSVEFMQTTWSALPHVLLYLTPSQKENNYLQTLYAFDAETVNSTVLVYPITFANIMYPLYDTAAFLIAGQGTRGGIVPRIIASDLSTQAIPFGNVELYNQFEIAPLWSPNHRKLMLYSNEELRYVIWWRSEHNGNVGHFEVPRQRNESVSVSWLTDDVMLVTARTDNQQKLRLLDTRSAQLHPLPSFLIDNVSILGHDDAYFAMNTPTGISVYKLSTGQLLLTAQISKEHLIPIFDPQEHAVLLIQDDNKSYSLQSLYLATSDGIQPISEQSILTRPAWSPDGSIFAFSRYDSTGQYLKVMSRDGTMLKEFSIAKYGYAWHDVRWTNCD